jgi:hypothetical protein
LGAGYASLGSFDGKSLGAGSKVDITGYTIRAGGGLDYYLTPVFSIGAAGTFEVLGLTRPGVELSTDPMVDPMTDPEAAQAEVYAADGSSLGIATTLTAVIGLHF